MPIGYDVRIAGFVLFLLLANCACPHTNDLWFRKIPELPSAALDFHAWREFIEVRSSEMDTAGRGLEFTGTPDRSRLVGQAPLILGSGEDGTSFRDVVRAMSVMWGIPFRIIDRLAIIGKEKSCYIPLQINGKCIDARSGNPVINFEVSGERGCLPSVFFTRDTNGLFSCSIPFRLDYMSSPAGVFLDDHFYRSRQTVVVRAPGYEPQTLECGVWNWRENWADREVEVRLEPSASQRGQVADMEEPDGRSQPARDGKP